MRNPEEQLISILKKTGIDALCTLPCDRIKHLIAMARTAFLHIPLTREEEGVGICAGLILAGKRPAMLIQNSGIGNMINALLSLTGFYQLPLPIFVSHRGLYKEKIAAQEPMGRKLPGILKGAGIPFSLIEGSRDLIAVERRLREVFTRNRIHAFLLSPAVWEESCAARSTQDAQRPFHPCTLSEPQKDIAGKGKTNRKNAKPEMTRFEILESIAPFLEQRAVVCNLGFPARELFHIADRPSNFYMLGSMGMVTPIALGTALASDREIFAIDGDGSLLMNPGTIATAAQFSPANLTIFAVDNGSYGSTGCQPTLTGSCVDLEAVARGFGIVRAITVSRKSEIIEAVKQSGGGLRFIRALARPGNRDVPIIPLSPIEIRRRFSDCLKSA